MDGWGRLCRDPDVERAVLKRLEETGLSERMRSVVRREVEAEGVGQGLVERTVYSCIVSSELHVQLKNAVFKELISLQQQVGVVPSLLAPPPGSQQLKEPLAFVRKAQEEWEGMLRRGVNALATDQAVPLARERSKSERDALRKRWNALGSDFSGLDKQHPIYSPKDFLEVLIRVKNTNFTPSGSTDSFDDGCGLMSFNLNVKSLYELREQFSTLSPSHLQLETAATKNSTAEYNDKTTKVLKMGLCSLSRQRCQTGCPTSDRRALWCSAMAVDTSLSKHAFHFEELRSAVLCSALLFDRLLVKDVKKTAANDDSFFVFEDTMHQILHCFLRDSSLLKHYQHLSITPMKAYINGSVGEPQCETVYPPSAAIPFHGFSLYVAPLCFLFDRSDHLYALFTEMYIRYFVHLHSVSSRPNGILGLCCQFECLLQARHPALFQHLSRIKAHPLRLVFGWMMVGFAGKLDSRQLLLLWDRIIGYNSTTILAVLAVAVLGFRATNLFKATSLSEAEAVLSDLRCLKVLPLLQQALFL